MGAGVKDAAGPTVAGAQILGWPGMKLCGCAGALSFPRPVSDLKKFSFLTASLKVYIPEGPALDDDASGWCGLLVTNTGVLAAAPRFTIVPTVAG